MTGLNRPHSGGGQLVWDQFPCSRQIHFPKPRGRKRPSEEEGQQEKDREGARREETETKKKKRAPEHNRERKLGPTASKVARGKK